jgi:ABC-type transport system involved in cytochrome c biogenesis permease subunit
MGLGVGIVLVAIGAVLALAVHVNPTNGAVDIHTIGWILVAVGALGIVLSMVFWSSWAGPGRFTRRTTDVGPTGETRTSTIDQR